MADGLLATWRRGVADLEVALATPAPPGHARPVGGPVVAAVALAFFAIVPSAYKSVAIPLRFWADEVAIAFAVVATAVAFVVVGGRREPRARAVALGLWPAPDPGGPLTPTLWTLGPLLVSAVGSVVALAATGRAPNLHAGGLWTLVVPVALAEELLFRGALLALAHIVLPPRWASAVVAASFGLWHVGNALGSTRDQPPIVQAGAVLVMFVAPAGASYVFTWLRFRTRSLLGAVLAHIGIDLFGTLAK